jgi:hypothetical protein
MLSCVQNELHQILSFWFYIQVGLNYPEESMELPKHSRFFFRAKRISKESSKNLAQESRFLPDSLEILFALKKTLECSGSSADYFLPQPDVNLDIQDHASPNNSAADHKRVM